MNSGTLPVLPPPDREGSGHSIKPDESQRDKKSNAGTGASAAGVRALTARLAGFYFRAPVRSFFKTRVDYLAYPRALLLSERATPTHWTQHTTPFLLAHTLRKQPLSFLPNTILPPLLANVSISTLLYTTYLASLSHYHPPSSTAQKRTFPPPPFPTTLLAGLTAGAIQTLFAAPFDALTNRFRTPDLSTGRYTNMWTYAARTLRRIGLRGAYAGCTLSLVKDSLGAGLFFSTFEYVKSQCFYAFVARWYGTGNLSREQEGEIRAAQWTGAKGTIRPHYAMEPAFLLAAGAAASVAQSAIMWPAGRVQEVYWRRVEGLDKVFGGMKGWEGTRGAFWGAYRRTGRECAVLARREGGWTRWLFGGFWKGTVRQVPSTAAGLIVFEIVRRKYGFDGEPKKIMMDGYDILLP
ncbi:hypothetical protein CAC42_7451 [Sphaceloma murrayae]|uniref:Uncharacterized protein n=1 Tax=Sphaceloma murrayae TaxID=2082308 RepID=A0A2K1QX35_9PEZI|nr:hypothetical protein CAC42_7451 [Sphaceloma murrayae]